MDPVDRADLVDFRHEIRGRFDDLAATIKELRDYQREQNGKVEAAARSLAVHEQRFVNIDERFSNFKDTKGRWMAIVLVIIAGGINWFIRR